MPRRTSVRALGIVAIVATLVTMSLAVVLAQLPLTVTDLVREPAIDYFRKPPADPVALLRQRIDSGSATLAYEPEQGYLRSMMRALHLEVDSQVLVYSKTSVQAARINPQNPRAIYFGDAVTLGYIRGADYLEFAAQDPQQGTIFYTLDQKPSDRPSIQRRDFCLSCHISVATLEVPGLLVRSIVTSPTGSTLPQLGNAVVDHRTPFAERWGGYYVTGRHGSIQHLGNALVERTDPQASHATAQNLTSLRDRFDVDAYPSPHADIAALLVFDHQMRMTNLLTRAGWDVRVAAAKQPDATTSIRELAAAIVDYMLFIDEAPLAAKIAGSSGFAQRFSSVGPHDRKGRSLRELALDRRLLRYPCSYMIYSDAFAQLPAAMHDAVYLRLADVLTGKLREPKYQRLSASDRQAVLEILRDTKSDWRF
jgi:hypothetical protein